MYQRLKKTNAVLGLLTIVLLIAHAGYNVFCYMAMYYNPVLKQVFSLPLIIALCLHAVLGMSLVFVHSDGTDLTVYSGFNKETILQRISAALMFPLLLIHIKTFEFMGNAAKSGALFVILLLILIEILFFGIVFTHIATSFSRALITLGLLGDMDKKRRIDKAMRVICGLMMVISVIAVVRTQLIMFTG